MKANGAFVRRGRAVLLISPFIITLTTQWSQIRPLSVEPSIDLTAHKQPAEIDLPISPDSSSTFRYDADSGMVQNLRLAIIGDSISRYQYLALVCFLHTGHWIKDDVSRNPLDRREFAREADFFNFTNSILKPSETCDCFRPDAGWNLKRWFENRYYRDDTKGNYVSFFTKMGKANTNGHLQPSEAWTGRALLSETPAAWSYSWTDLIRNHITELVPKPDYLIFNAGLWAHDLLNTTVFSDIEAVLKQANIRGIYKTTSKRYRDRTTSLQEHDKQGCKLFPCVDLSWTGDLTLAGYVDQSHFKPSVNRKMNEQMFALLGTL